MQILPMRVLVLYSCLKQDAALIMPMWQSELF